VQKARSERVAVLPGAVGVLLRCDRRRLHRCDRCHRSGCDRRRPRDLVRLTTRRSQAPT